MIQEYVLICSLYIAAKCRIYAPVKYAISGSDSGLSSCSAPSNNTKHSWLIINWTQGNKFLSKVNKHTIFIQENEFPAEWRTFCLGLYSFDFIDSFFTYTVRIIMSAVYCQTQRGLVFPLPVVLTGWVMSSLGFVRVGIVRVGNVRVGIVRVGDILEAFTGASVSRYSSMPFSFGSIRCPHHFVSQFFRNCQRHSNFHIHASTGIGPVSIQPVKQIQIQILSLHICVPYFNMKKSSRYFRLKRICLLGILSRRIFYHAHRGLQFY